MRTTAEHIKHVSGAHLGFLEGRDPDFRKRANQYETTSDTNDISVITF